MNTKEMMAPETPFSNEIIFNQIQKIFVANPFCTSPILRNFLRFIVSEYMAGRSEHIKEYTIATQVMKRPVSFSPQTDGIVRIHARRLRLALEHYYQGEGSQDELYIAIPKGRYKPSFAFFGTTANIQVRETHKLNKINAVKIAVLPFKTFELGMSSIAFADHLGQNLSSELSGTIQYSVISYHLVRDLHVKNKSIEHLASAYGAHFVVTGNIQFENQKIRVSVQLVNTYDAVQIWSNIYHLDYSSDHYFELTDILVARMMDLLGDPHGQVMKRLTIALSENNRHAALMNG